ncbi:MULTISPECIES: hypothetical protein [Chryseobacterium]|uniref:Uncharacterized protein n=1 Tax=Chryseobacterium geocarposphaerae TaxID=1416776 RepID=A0ABU1LDI9_9FLAO|nr:MULTISPECIES: hypothetical protein [Chryseobacterium]MDR6404769.1 hypothetical protein [Chryseobacterium geocarposphaerae]MDR6697998.1 hypothetical protein [Chryseobacterium ginsenosidimutans]
MKKILLTATMLVGFAALSQAQQGRVGVNTTTPAATLDVVANTTDATKPDALLVPRMTRAQLAAKDAAYVAAQNGALAFITTLDGTAAGKTVNVTATGFYYYDAPNSVWVAVGGGGAAPTQRYEVIRGNTRNITSSNYTVAADDYFIITNAPSGVVTLTFPALTAADAGRVVYVYNNNVATGLNVINNVAGQTGMNQFRGYPVLWSGSAWIALTK